MHLSKVATRMLLGHAHASFNIWHLAMLRHAPSPTLALLRPLHPNRLNAVFHYHMQSIHPGKAVGREPTSRWYVYARPAKVLACPGRMLRALSKQAAASLNMRSLRKVCPNAVSVGSDAACKAALPLFLTGNASHHLSPLIFQGCQTVPCLRLNSSRFQTQPDHVQLVTCPVCKLQATKQNT